MAVHLLKTELPYWNAVKSGFKKFEVRKDDRDFAVNDVLLLLASKDGAYIRDDDGKKMEIARRVTYVLRGGQYGLAEGYVIMSLVGDE